AVERADERAARIGVIEEPLPGFRLREGGRPKTESQWLDHVGAKIQQAGFSFPRRLLEAFHTSLKAAEWSPLTILARVSGTGKSELPRLYARFGGLHFEPVAVQPNWDSPQDLWGFFNYMDNRFNAKRILRAMAQSQRDSGDREGFNDALLLVLFDE